MQNNIVRFIFALFCSFAAVGLSSCNDEWTSAASDEETTVSFLFQTEEEDAASHPATRAVTGITDVMVFIFNQQGDLIGKGEAGSASSLNVMTRKATGCTVYVVANSKTAVSSTWLSNVNTKAGFDNMYYNVQSSGSPKISDLMFGKVSNFSTQGSTSCSVSLSKIYSNMSFSITIEKDKTTGIGIVVDSYQLCHLPKGTFLSNTKQSTTYYDESEVSLTSNNESGATISFSRSILQNPLPKGTNDNSKGWGYRSSANAPANASYLKIKAHSQMWETTFYYYLGGKNLPSSYSASADYTDYTIYPNLNYKAAITMNGNGAEEDGNRVNVTLQSVTVNDLGKIICADGSVYETVSLAKAAGKEPIGFIGYVGNEAADAPYNHGIVFALENVNEVNAGNIGYDEAFEVAKTYKGAAMKFSSGWHIPSVEEWNRMFASFGGHEYGVPTKDNDPWEFGNTKQKMLDAGGNAFWDGSNFAALTTFNGEEGFWVYRFQEDEGGSGMWFWRTSKFTRAVRLCFVF